jgi:hypothetical protein
MKLETEPVTVTLDAEISRLLRRCAERDGKSIIETIVKAIDHYDRIRFFEIADAAYKALRADPEAWAEELEERRLWDVTLLDGIEPEDHSSP